MVKTRGLKKAVYRPNYTPPSSPDVPKRKRNKQLLEDEGEWKPKKCKFAPPVNVMRKIVALYEEGRSERSIQKRYSWYTDDFIEAFKRELELDSFKSDKEKVKKKKVRRTTKPESEVDSSEDEKSPNTSSGANQSESEEEKRVEVEEESEEDELPSSSSSSSSSSVDDEELYTSDDESPKKVKKYRD